MINKTKKFIKEIKEMALTIEGCESIVCHCLEFNGEIKDYEEKINAEEKLVDWVRGQTKEFLVLSDEEDKKIDELFESKAAKCSMEPMLSVEINMFLSVEDIAKELGVHTMTVYRLISGKKIPSYKIGNQIRVKREELTKFLEGCKR